MARHTSSIRAATSWRSASEDKTELITAEMDLDMIEEVRRVWQFYRDRRPETYGRWRSSCHEATMTMLITGGTVVTATDIYPGDVLIEGEKSAPLARRSPCRPIGSSTRRANTCCRAASTSTRISTCRSAARRPPTTSSRARSRRRTAARRRSSTSLSSTRARRCTTRGKRG